MSPNFGVFFATVPYVFMMQSFNKDLMMHLLFFSGVHTKAQIFLWCTFMLASCGKGFDLNPAPKDDLESGRFFSNLRSLNTKIGRYGGWVSITISDNQFWVRIKVTGPKTESMHAQYLHSNAICPDMNDDTNGDGFLDFLEANAVSGPILIPLDSDLKSQFKGLNIFPKMNRSFYYYSEACNTSLMMEDLRQSDQYSSDMMIKLKSDEELGLRRRVIMIYGTNEDRFLPPSVASFQGYPSQASIPIACGVIEVGELDGFSP